MSKVGLITGSGNGLGRDIAEAAVPVRLILGVDAEKRVRQAEAARAGEAEKCRHLTVSTVFEDRR
jgi:hypothetical protein